LFIFWAVAAALSLFVFIAPLLIPLRAAIRNYANAYRRWARRVLGVPSAPAGKAAPTMSSYPQTAPSARPYPPRRIFARTLVAPLLDGMTWREWAWLLVNSTAGFFLGVLQVLI